MNSNKMENRSDLLFWAVHQNLATDQDYLSRLPDSLQQEVEETVDEYRRQVLDDRTGYMVEQAEDAETDGANESGIRLAEQAYVASQVERTFSCLQDQKTREIFKRAPEADSWQELVEESPYNSAPPVTDRLNELEGKNLLRIERSPGKHTVYEYTIAGQHARPMVTQLEDYADAHSDELLALLDK